MRILFVTKSQKFTGTYWRGWHLGSELAKAGFDFTLVCPGRTGIIAPAFSRPTPNLRVVELPRLSDTTHYLGMALRSAWGLARWHPEDYDIVHSCAPAFPETWLPALIAKKRGVPVLVDLDDWWGRIPDGRRPRLESWLEERLETSAVSLASCMVAVSEELVERRGSLCKGRALVLPNGVNPSHFNGLYHDESRSRLREELGLDSDMPVVVALYDPRFAQLFIDLGTLLAKSRRKAVLLLVGFRASDPAGSKRRSPPEVRYGGGPVVYPEQEHRRTLDLITAADVLVLPMVDDCFDRSRFPVKLPELLATGRPLISSAVGKTRRVLLAAGYSDTTGGLVRHTNANAFLEGVQQAFDNLEHMEEVAREAKEYTLEQLSWAHIASDCAKVYTEVAMHT